MFLGVMIASGAIGGLAGGIHALGLVHRFVAGFSPGYGFTGIAIALLARNTATGVVVASILFGALSSAGANIQLFSNVPIEIVADPPGRGDDLRGRSVRRRTLPRGAPA